MSVQLEKKVVKYVLSTKTVSINIADFENVVDGIKDEEIKSQIFKVGLVLMFFLKCLFLFLSSYGSVFAGREFWLFHIIFFKSRAFV